jgi:hypothetical protein
LGSLGTSTEDAAAQAFRVASKCQLASKSLAGFALPPPTGRQAANATCRHHLIEAIALALSIKDEFYKGLAIQQVINVCRSTNDFEIARILFKGVEHDLLREQIAKDAPELADEKPVVSDGRAAVEVSTIHLDGLDRETIIRVIAKAMREGGACEREIEGFKRTAANANSETVLANALLWGAPVRFLKEGRPWVAGDWRRLTLWQRVKRRASLWRGSYVHPDGTVELRGRRADPRPDE